MLSKHSHPGGLVASCFIVAVFVVSGHWLWFGGRMGGIWAGWLAEARIWVFLLL